MPDVTSYKPGEFSWADLQTTDPKAAKKFYSDLFGWKSDELPMDQGAVYIMAKVEGKDVAAMGGLPPEQAKAGIPPHWNTYFTVANVDESTKKATSLGGKAVMPAFDVMDVGRMSVVADPSGAMFCLWQGKKHIGAGKRLEPNTLCWAELATRDVDRCGSFYSKLFDWKTEAMNMGSMTYTVFHAGKPREDGRAGMMGIGKDMPAQMPSNWTPYFAVASTDKAAEKVKSSGGKVLVPPQDIPNTGRFAIFQDPQGATFAVLQPSM